MREYNPMQGAVQTQRGLVDSLTGMPIAAPVADPLQTVTPVTAAPQVAAPAQTQAAPAQVGSLVQANPDGTIKINTVDYARANNFSDLSMDSQKEFRDKMAAEINQTLGDQSPGLDAIKQGITQKLDTLEGSYLTKPPESSTLRNVASTGAQAVTGLVSAVGGLVNLAGNAVGLGEYTAPIAHVTEELDVGARSIGSAAKQDYEKRSAELMQQGKYGDAIGHMMDNPAFGLQDLISIIGVGGGATLAAKAGIKSAVRLVGKEAAEAGSKAAARQGTQALLVGQGGLAAGMQSQRLSAQNPDGTLTGQQIIGSLASGVAGAATAYIPAKLGYTIDSMIAGAGRAAVTPAATRSIALSALQSAGLDSTANAVQSSVDAAIRTGYDKQGNFNPSNIEWDRVGGEALYGGTIGAVMGAAAGAAGAARSNRIVRETEAAAAEQGAPTATTEAPPTAAATEAAGATAGERATPTLPEVVGPVQTVPEGSVQNWSQRARSEYEAVPDDQKINYAGQIAAAAETAAGRLRQAQADLVTAKAAERRALEPTDPLRTPDTTEASMIVRQAEQNVALQQALVEHAKTLNDTVTQVHSKEMEAATRQRETADRDAAAKEAEAARKEAEAAKANVSEHLAAMEAARIGREAADKAASEARQARAAEALAQRRQALIEQARRDEQARIAEENRKLNTQQAAESNEASALADVAKAQRLASEARSPQSLTRANDALLAAQDRLRVAREHRRRLTEEPLDPESMVDAPIPRDAFVPPVQNTQLRDQLQQLTQDPLRQPTEPPATTAEPVVDAGGPMRNQSTYVQASRHASLNQGSLQPTAYLREFWNSVSAGREMERVGKSDAEGVAHRNELKQTLAAIEQRGVGKRAASKDAQAAAQATALLDVLRNHERTIQPGEMSVHQARTEAKAVGAGKPEAATDPLMNDNHVMRDHLEKGDVFSALESITVGGKKHPIVNALIKTLRLNDVALRVRLVDDPINLRGTMHDAAYFPDSGEIHILREKAGQPYYLVHEAAHAAIDRFLVNADYLEGRQKASYDKLNQLYHEALVRPDMPAYAKTDIREFVAEAFSNPRMQEFLQYKSEVSGMAKFRNVFKGFIDAIRTFLGLAPKDTNALVDVVGLTRLVADTNTKAESIAGSLGVEAPSTFAPQAATVWRRIVDPDGSSRYDDIGAVERDAAGDYVMRFDDGHTGDLVFTDMDAAATWARENLNAVLSDFTNESAAVRVGAMTKMDSLSPQMQTILNAVSRTTAFLGPENSAWITQKIITGARWWKTNMIDPLTMVSELDNYLRTKGIDSNLRHTFRTNDAHSRALFGRPGAVLQDILTDLNAGLSKIGSTTNEFGMYLYARHVPERNRHYVGQGQVGAPGARTTDVTGFEYNGLKGDDAAKAFMDALPPSKREAFDRMARPLAEMQQTVLTEELRSGIIDADSYNRLGGLDENGRRQKGAYEFYVPLWNKGHEGSYIPRTGVSGRWSMADNPLLTQMVQLQQRMGRVDRNDSMSALYRTLKQNPMPDLVSYETYQIRRDLDGTVKAVPDSYKSAKDSVWFFEDGRMVRMKMASTAEGKLLYKGLAGDSQPRNAILQSFAAVTRQMAALNTTFNPAFLMKTIAWDATTTLLNFQNAFDRSLTPSEGFRLAAKTLAETPGLLPFVARDRFQGKTDMPLYALYGRQGGGINAGVFAGMERIQDNLLYHGVLRSKDILQTHGPLKGGLKVAQGGLDRLVHTLHSTDDAIRFAAFRNYLEYKSGQRLRDMSETELATWAGQNQQLVNNAVIGSKELNGNFEQRGASTFMPSLYAFWNAAMQGTRLMAGIGNSKQGQYGLAAMIALGAYAAAQGTSLPEDEEAGGQSKYAASRARTQAALISGGVEGGFQVPIAYEARPFYMLGNAVTLALTGKISWGKATTDILKTGTDILSPITPIGSGDTGFDTAYMFTPTALQWTFPALLGKNAFGKDVDADFVKDPISGKRIADPASFERGKPQGSQLLQQATSRLYDATGIDVSPARIEASALTIMGGAYTTLNQAFSQPTKKIGFGESPITQSLTKAYMSTPNDYAVQTEYKDRLQDYQVAYRQKVRSLPGGGTDILTRPTDKAGMIDAAVQRQLKGLHVDGQSESALYEAAAKAQAAGDEAAQSVVAQQLMQLRLQKNAILSMGLKQLEDLHEEN